MPPRSTGTPRPTATTSPTDSLVLQLVPGVTLELVRVSAGTFLMGSTDADKDAWDHEKPQRSVHLDEYLVDKYPVTVAQWRAFVQASGYKGSPSALRQGKEDHPVTNVTWNDAQTFCAWASEVTGRPVQLPTEAQWEKAARGTDGRIYPWGDAFNPALANTAEGGPGSTTAVGRYRSSDSPYGCADMAGNVWEWTSSLYRDYPYRAGDGHEDAANDSEYRIVRGGSWDYYQRVARCAYRRRLFPNYRNFDLGFRVVVTLASSLSG